MNIFSTVKKKLFLNAAIVMGLILFICSICSCSNNAPQLREANLTIIFDYKSKDSLPTARMGVFVEAVSNQKRIDSLKVFAKGSDLIWESNNLLLAENEEQKYLGCVNLVMPQNQEFPAGEYTIEFQQYDEEKTEMKYVLSYDKSFYNAKTEQVASLMNKNMGSRMLKIFDADKKVIYYGPRTYEFSTARGIWNVYSQAKEFQEIWISGNKNVICNFPIEKVEPGV